MAIFAFSAKGDAPGHAPPRVWAHPAELHRLGRSPKGDKPLRGQTKRPVLELPLQGADTAKLYAILKKNL